MSLWWCSADLYKLWRGNEFFLAPGAITPTAKSWEVPNLVGNKGSNPPTPSYGSACILHRCFIVRRCAISAVNTKQKFQLPGWYVTNRAEEISKGGRSRLRFSLPTKKGFAPLAKSFCIRQGTMKHHHLLRIGLLMFAVTSTTIAALLPCTSPDCPEYWTEGLFCIIYVDNFATAILILQDNLNTK